MSETYSVPVECTNCYKGGHVEIQKGTLVPQVVTCPNCGCDTASPCQAGKKDDGWGKWPIQPIKPYRPWTLQTEPFGFNPPQLLSPCHVGAFQ